MQSIGNVEHTGGKRADPPLWPGGAPVELRDGVNCLAISCKKRLARYAALGYTLTDVLNF